MRYLKGKFTSDFLIILLYTFSYLQVINSYWCAVLILRLYKIIEVYNKLAERISVG